MTKTTTKVKLQDHGKRNHALLSASGANRWINCTPSAKLEESFGEKTYSAYAEEGTLAHELSELYLNRDVLKAITDEDFDNRLDGIMANDLFNEEMLGVLPTYTDYCVSQLIEAQTINPLATMEIEQKLDLTEYVPESFGTADCIIINDNTLEVIDLKYGKGVPVYADNNRQLMLYGLGALRKYDVIYNIENVRLTIVQPRLDNISTFLIPIYDLRKWAEEELKPAADLAFEGKGELKSGDWCKFCSVRNQCKKLYEDQMKIAKFDFAPPTMLSDKEITDIVKRAPKFIEWVDSIQDYAQAKALDGKEWPGLKLVEGISKRKWVDEDKAADVIKHKCPWLSDDEIFNMKLKSLTTIEKIIGKVSFANDFSDIIVKPQGKPTLVPLEDKRPAMGYGQATLDFKE